MIGRRTRPATWTYSVPQAGRYVAAATRADRITQAVLARAFRGELVPTEADLARQEGRAYEPAAVLLAPIKGARAGKGGVDGGRDTTARKAHSG